MYNTCTCYYNYRPFITGAFLVILSTFLYSQPSPKLLALPITVDNKSTKSSTQTTWMTELIQFQTECVYKNGFPYDIMGNNHYIICFCFYWPLTSLLSKLVLSHLEPQPSSASYSVTWPYYHVWMILNQTITHQQLQNNLENKGNIFISCSALCTMWSYPLMRS